MGISNLNQENNRMLSLKTADEWEATRKVNMKVGQIDSWLSKMAIIILKN